MLVNSEKINNILEKSKIFIICIDINTLRIKDVSPSVKGVLGYERENFTKDKYLYESLLYPDSKNLFYSTIKKAIKDKTDAYSEYRIVAETGEEIWVSQKSYVNEYESVECIIEDITGRKNVELEISEYHEHLKLILKKRTEEIAQISEELASTNEELYKTNERLVKEIEERKRTEKELLNIKNTLEDLVKEKTQSIITLSNSIPKGFIFTAESNEKMVLQITYISNQIKDIMGIDPNRAKLSLDTARKIIYPEDYKSLVENYKKAIKQGVFLEHEFRIAKQGEKRWLLIRSKPQRNGKTTRWDGIVIDITEKKIAEQKLKISEQRYRFLFEQAAEGILLVNYPGEIVDANRSALKISGYNKNELLHSNWYKLFLFSGQKKKISNLKPGHSLFVETKLKKSDGYIIDVEVNMKRLSTDNYQLFFRDVTERKQTEQQILKAIIETEESERKKFAENIHDGLGPLLSSIKLYVKLIEKEKDPDKRKLLTKNLYEVIDESIISVKEISNNLSPHILEDFGLVAAIKNFCAKLPKAKIAYSINVKNLNFRLDRKTEVTLYRAITELINNTIKYAEAKKIAIDIIVKNKNVEVVYTDDGKGFDIDKVNKGFGLIYLKNRIKSLNGDIFIKSKENKGIFVKIILDLDNNK